MEIIDQELIYLGGSVHNKTRDGVGGLCELDLCVFGDFVCRRIGDKRNGFS